MCSLLARTLINFFAVSAAADYDDASVECRFLPPTLPLPPLLPLLNHRTVSQLNSGPELLKPCKESKLIMLQLGLLCVCIQTTHHHFVDTTHATANLSFILPFSIFGIFTLSFCLFCVLFVLLLFPLQAVHKHSKSQWAMKLIKDRSQECLTCSVCPCVRRLTESTAN